MRCREMSMNKPGGDRSENEVNLNYLNQNPYIWDIYTGFCEIL